MAEIRPFTGIRFNQAVVKSLASVVAPPYDVIGAAAQTELYWRDPHNIIRLELGEQLPEDSPSDNRYTRSAACFAEWLRRGVLEAEAAPALYVYEQAFRHNEREYTRTGLLAAMRLEEWHKGIVLPHEATMSGPKMDRLNLMRATGANFSPIFALYDDLSHAARAVFAEVTEGEPVVSFGDEEGEHRLWLVTGRDAIESLEGVLNGSSVYIADGHHRYETALFYRDEQRVANRNFTGNEAWNFVMTFLVALDDPGLIVLPTHRMVNPAADTKDLEAELRRLFVVEVSPSAGGRQSGLNRLLAAMASKGQEGQSYGLYGLPPGHFALLRPRAAGDAGGLMPENRVPEWRQLDVAILHELLLRRVFELTEDDCEDEKRVAYTRDAEEAVGAVDAGHYKFAVLLNPTPASQVIAVARAGEVMPRKSTYFHPKPLTGLVINRLTDMLW